MNRLRELRKEKGLTMKSFGTLFNIAESTVSLYETEKRDIDVSLLGKFSKYFEVSVDYLLGLTDESNINITTMESPISVGTKIKVLGKVPAGIPIEAVECVIDEIDISKEMADDDHEYLGLLVSGDSMFPEYLDGDIVIIRKQPTAETGDDVVAYVNGYDATLKRLQRMSNGIRLKALNPQYESKFYSNDEIKKLPVSILGVVVEMRRTKK